MNVIRMNIVYVLPFEQNSSVRRANERSPIDDRRALEGRSVGCRRGLKIAVYGIYCDIKA